MHHIPSKLFRQGLFAVALLLQFVLLSTGAYADSPAKDGYNPDVKGLVFTSVIQPDGKLVIGGLFTAVKGTPRSNIARINVDGSLDTSFTIGTDAAVTVLLRQPDGKLLIGGKFGYMGVLDSKSVLSNTVQRRGLARLLTDGSVDSTWLPALKQANLPSLFKVQALAFQRDGKLLVGGRFDTYVGADVDTNLKDLIEGTASRNNVLRLNADGTLDTSFKVGVNDVVMSILVTPDGKIVLGGGFTKTTTLPDGVGMTYEAGRIAMYTVDGALLPRFNTYFDNRVNVLLNCPTGGFYVGGAYTQVEPVDLSQTGTARGAVRTVNNLCLLNVDGTLSSTFASTANGEVHALALQPDGALLVGGNFTEIVSGSPYIRAVTNYAGRVLASGYPDRTFYAGMNEVVSSIAVQADGRIILSGYFARVSVAGDSISTPRNHVARVQRDGTLDTDFSFAPSGEYSDIQVLSDGSGFLINGSFSDIGGSTRTGVALLNAAGVLQASYENIRINGTVSAAVLQSDKSLLIGGSFTAIRQNGDTTDTERLYLARLTPEGKLDTGFVPPKLDGPVKAIGLQADGSIVISGNFSSLVSGTTTTTTTTQYYMARLDKNGTHDTTFMPGPNMPPSIIRVLADGKMWVAGDFTSFTPNKGSKSFYTGYLARLNADGTLDTTFGTPLNGAVNSFSVQDDGKIYVSGIFNSLTVTVNGTAYSLSGVARLNADGSLDNTFVVQTNASVNSVYASGDFVYLGGSFTTLKDIANITASTSVSRYYMGRVSKTGTIDTTYNPNPDKVVRRIVPLDKRLLVVGDFAGFSPNNSDVSVPALGMAALNSDGTVDTSFYLSAAKPSSVDSKINFVLHEPDEYLMVGGKFTGLNGSLTSNLMRMTAAGRRDTSFSAAPNGEVAAGVALPVETELLNTNVGFAWLKSSGETEQIRIGNLPAINGTIVAIGRQSDGKLILGGSFYITDNKGYYNLIRLNQNGTLDTSFLVPVDSTIYSILIQDDDRILLSGAFTSISSTTRNYMARLSKDGVLDTTFNPNFDAAVKTMAISADKASIYVGGAFTTVFGKSTSTTAVARSYIAKLALADGDVDTAFIPYLNSQVNSLVVQADGKKLVIGGSFTNVQPVGSTSYTARKYIARLNADGTLDTSFDPGADSAVASIALEKDGNILVGGSFANFYPNATTTATPIKYFARLTDAGLVDTTLNLSLNGTVNTIAIQSTEDILIGGSFTKVNSFNRVGIARLSKKGTVDKVMAALVYSSTQIIKVISSADASLNDTILLGGSFSRARAEPFMVIGGSFTQISDYTITNLARLYIDGGVDMSFQPNPNGKIKALARQADGKLIVGGEFTNIAGQAVSNLVRFNTDGTLDSSFTASFGTSVTALTQTRTGQVLVGGSTGILARLNANGTVDSSFAASLGASVNSIAVAANGDVLVGLAGSPYFVALNPSSGARSSTVTPDLDGAVNSVVVAADGTVSIGGAFTKVGNTTVSKFARINTDGSVGSNLPASIDGAVSTIMVTEDGKAMIGGNFGTVDGLPRYMLARLAAPIQATNATVQRLSYDDYSNTLVWSRSGSLPAITRAYIEQSSDDVTWTPVGTGVLTLVGTDWVSDSIKLSATGSYNLRARGILQSSPGGSSGFVSARFSGTGASLAGIARLADRVFTFTAVNLNLIDILGITPSAVTGLPAGLSYNIATGIISGIPTQTGSGSVTITWFDGVYNRTSLFNYATIDSKYVPDAAQRIANFSIRSKVLAGKAVTGGIVIMGSAPKTVLIRAVGPTLASYGYQAADCMPNPMLKLSNLPSVAGQSVVTVKENVGAWGGDAEVTAAMARLGAFTLDVKSADCAFLVTLNPGNYSFEVKDKNGAGGLVLLEAYDAAADLTEAQHMINISGKSTAGSGDSIVVGGFVLSKATQRVLVRAVGQSLLQYGVELPMRDPLLKLFRNGILIAKNDDWGVQENLTGSDLSLYPAAVVAKTIAEAYAFPFTVTDSKSSALLVDLPAGLYTAEAISVDGFSGPVILEIYQIQ